MNRPITNGNRQINEAFAFDRHSEQMDFRRNHKKARTLVQAFCFGVFAVPLLMR